MKQYTNIFIVIGFIVLTYGQIQGSQELKNRQEDIEKFKQKIRTEQEKTREGDNFYKVFLEGEELWRLLLEDYYINRLFTESDYSDLLNEFKKAEGLLFDAVLTNSIELANYIIQYVKMIEGNIKQLQKSDNFFVFNIKEIMNLIDRRIKLLLDSTRQRGIFVDELLESKADKQNWQRAKKKTQDVIAEVETLLDTLVEYIKFLNEASKKEKAENLLKIIHFDVTASALQVMDYFINILYVELSKIFVKDVPLRDILDTFITNQNKILSMLKTALYKIYEVRRETDDKIAIRYYHASLLPGQTGFYYSDSQADPLMNIDPSVGTIEEGRISRERFLERTKIVDRRSIIKKFKEKMKSWAKLFVAIKFEIEEVVEAVRIVKTYLMTEQPVGLEEAMGMERRRKERVRAYKEMMRTEVSRDRAERIGLLGRQVAKKVGYSLPGEIEYDTFQSKADSRVLRVADSIQAKIKLAVEQEEEGEVGAINKNLAEIPKIVKERLPVEKIETMRKIRQWALKVVQQELSAATKWMVDRKIKKGIEQHAIRVAIFVVEEGIEQEKVGEKGAKTRAFETARKKIKEWVKYYTTREEEARRSVEPRLRGFGVSRSSL